jgi:hypothetical protein
LDVLIPEQTFSSFGIEMVNLHSQTAPTIARKEAARTAREAYEKRKTRQVAAKSEQMAADAEVDLFPDKSFRQPEIWASVDVTPQRGRRSGARLLEAVPAAAPEAAPAAAPESVPVASSAPSVTTAAAAMKLILAAAAAGKAFTFVQQNPKTGKSGERYEVYKKEAMFEGLKALQRV